MLIPLMLEPYKYAHSDLGTVECINMYPSDPMYDEVSRTQTPSAFKHTSGYKLFSSIDGIQVRGLLAFNNIGYAVIDSKLYTITPTGTAVNVGTLTSTVGRIQMQSNGAQIWIVNCEGNDSYVYTIATATLAAITDPDYPSNLDFNYVRHTAYSDGYGIAVTQDGRFYLSTPLDFSSWSALDFAIPEYQADKLKAIVVSKEELVLLSDETVEFWYQSGDAFAYTRRPLASMRMGVTSRFTAIPLDDGVFWLTKNIYGQGYIVRSDSSYNVERLSTEFLEYEINSYQTLDDAFALAYQDQGRLFYHITFPSAGVTWVYDLSTKMWHKRLSVSRTLPTGPLRQHTANNIMNLSGHLVIGDYESGNLYELKDTAYTDYDQIIHRRVTSAILQQDLNRISFSELELEINAGHALAIGQGSEPLIGLQTSKDRGNTWSPRFDIPMGETGQYKTRVKWNRLGQARYWNFRFIMTEPIPFTILRANAHGSIEGQGQQGRQ